MHVLKLGRDIISLKQHKNSSQVVKNVLRYFNAAAPVSFLPAGWLLSPVQMPNLSSKCWSGEGRVGWDCGTNSEQRIAIQIPFHYRLETNEEWSLAPGEINHQKCLCLPWNMHVSTVNTRCQGKTRHFDLFSPVLTVQVYVGSVEGWHHDNKRVHCFYYMVPHCTSTVYTTVSL